MTGVRDAVTIVPVGQVDLGGREIPAATAYFGLARHQRVNPTGVDPVMAASGHGAEERRASGDEAPGVVRGGGAGVRAATLWAMTPQGAAVARRVGARI